MTRTHTLGDGQTHLHRLGEGAFDRLTILILHRDVEDRGSCSKLRVRGPFLFRHWSDGEVGDFRVGIGDGDRGGWLRLRLHGEGIAALGREARARQGIIHQRVARPPGGSVIALLPEKIIVHGVRGVPLESDRVAPATDRHCIIA